VYVYDVSGCFDSACVTVFVTTVVEPLDCSKAKIKDVFFPNAFSPNGDLENDVAKTYYSYKECIETFRIVIYNRWGEKIFSSEDPYFEWNGMRNEKPENTGVFIYLMRIKFVSGETDVVRGNLSLLR
jgi:gliding motility-associated-like protein